MKRVVKDWNVGKWWSPHHILKRYVDVALRDVFDVTQYVKLMVRHGDLKGLFQPKCFSDSLILCSF